MPVSLQHIVALKKQKLCHLQDGFEMFLSTKAEYIQKFFWACLDCQVILTVAKLLKKYSTENMRCYLAFWLTTDRLYVCLLFKTAIHHFHSYPLLLKETRPGSSFYSLEKNGSIIEKFPNNSSNIGKQYLRNWWKPFGYKASFRVPVQKQTLHIS